MLDAGDVRDEDGLDGERTGRPRSIWSSGWMKSTVVVLLDIYSGDGEHNGRDDDDVHGKHGTGEI